MHGHKNIPSANPLFSGIIISSPYLHISTIRVNWLVLITVVESVYSAVRTGSLYKADYVSSSEGKQMSSNKPSEANS